jgi:hypothetical protein
LFFLPVVCAGSNYPERVSVIIHLSIWRKGADNT